ncbi:uncharacterized protein si:dkeyp-122a9.1 [Pristis pectinata]|uniref:uncharacterized protein si:dkeyp-122a9.1 n=1 Tax=Pristis pectinata TaxID=685728 RepID=UPI00223C9043|nr:uncharacterized protein si:dkeyp-122a9.1 [Pristis pectinata]
MALEAFKLLKEAILKICPSVAKVTQNAALTAVLYGIEYMMEKNNRCPCDPEWNRTYALTTFITPATFFFMVSLLTLPASRRLLKCAVCYCPRRGETSPTPSQGETSHTLSRDETSSTQGCCKNYCTCRQWLFGLATLMKVSIPSIIWVVILLLDGDYYTCYWLPSNNQTARIPKCKDFCNITASLEERRLCTASQWIGAIVLAVTVSLLVVFYFLQWCKCTDCTQERYYEEKFQQKLAEKKRTKMKEELEKIATECAEVEAGKLIGKMNLGNTEQGQQQSNQSTENYAAAANPNPKRGVSPPHRICDNIQLESLSPLLLQPGSVQRSTTTQPRQNSLPQHRRFETGATNSSHKLETQIYFTSFGKPVPKFH